ncbi:MAG: hypothetical protein ACLR6O_02220 [Eubacterium sp.]
MIFVKEKKSVQIYNSRDKSYKSIVSAIATNEKCKFRIIVPRDMKCCAAQLAITMDGEHGILQYVLGRNVRRQL